MNKNRLWIAVVVLLGLGGAAASAMRSREAETEITKPNASLPALKTDDITSLELQIPNKGSVSLSKQDGTWNVVAPLSAKADQAAVTSMLEKLAALEVKGVAASRKENHARLEVDEAQGLRVKVSAGDKLLADLLIGANKGGNTMVRVDGADEVLSVKGDFRYLFNKELKLLRDRVILNVEPKDVMGLTLSSAKGSFKFQKVEGKWTQTLAKGQKAIARFSEPKLQTLVNTLARLNAADFAEATETPEALGFGAPAATAVLSMADGTTHTLELGKESGSNEFALRLVGNEVIFRIAKYNADRFLVDASAFQDSEDKPAAQAQAPAGLDPAKELPPEVLRQLEQMAPR